LEANPRTAHGTGELTPDILTLGRGSVGPPSTREIARVTDELVDDVPVRIYEHGATPTGVIVYFHGGGWSIGSIGMMDNVARELAHGAGAVVVSVGYRLAPEDPYPAGLDDCEAVTRWAVARAARWDVASDHVVVAGESAGGNLAAAVALRLRDDAAIALAGQLLMYPAVDAGSVAYPSRTDFEGLVLSRDAMASSWAAYAGGRDIDRDPFAAPLQAESFAGLPPALVVLGGCDLLRDEGRLYASRLREAGVDVDEVCYPGQVHGFLNLMFPAAAQAFDHMGDWLRQVFEGRRGA
jgi:acetyl esterase